MHIAQVARQKCRLLLQEKLSKKTDFNSLVHRTFDAV